jgi:hypothetical protein
MPTRKFDRPPNMRSLTKASSLSKTPHSHSVINESPNQLILLPCQRRQKFDIVIFTVAKHLEAGYTTQLATICESLGCQIRLKIIGDRAILGGFDRIPAVLSKRSPCVSCPTTAYW